jgi:hypothetical protein
MVDILGNTVVWDFHMVTNDVKNGSIGLDMGKIWCYMVTKQAYMVVDCMIFLTLSLYEKLYMVIMIFYGRHLRLSIWYTFGLTILANHIG